MLWEYSEWDQTLQDLLKSFQDLMSLFNYLLLMAGGDVDKVFKWMEYLQERGIAGSRRGPRGVPSEAGGEAASSRS